MRHRIDKVVDAVVIRQRSHGLRVNRRVGIFPSVADIRIEVDGDDHAVPVVGDGAPGRSRPVRLLHYARAARPPPKGAGPAGEPKTLLLYAVEPWHNGLRM